MAGIWTHEPCLQSRALYPLDHSIMSTESNSSSPNQIIHIPTAPGNAADH